LNNYIYLNNKKYIEIPKEYNIKKDVYMWSSISSDKLLKDALSSVIKNDNILVKTELIFPEKYGYYAKEDKSISPEIREYLTNKRNKVIRHELQHIAQHENPRWLGGTDIKPSGFFMREMTPHQRYMYFRKKYGQFVNPYEKDARELEFKNIKLKYFDEELNKESKKNKVLERLNKTRF